MSELLTRRRFTVEEYHRMGKAGIPPEDNPCRVARSRASRSVRSAQHRRRRGTRAGLVLSAPGWQNSTTSFAAVVRASPQDLTLAREEPTSSAPRSSWRTPRAEALRRLIRE